MCFHSRQWASSMSRQVNHLGFYFVSESATVNEGGHINNVVESGIGREQSVKESPPTCILRLL